MSTKKTLKDLSWDELLHETSYEVERNERIKSYAHIGGKKGGNTNKESGHMSTLGKDWGKINGSHPNSVKAATIQGKKNVESGHMQRLAESLTFEQRSKGGKKGGAIVRDSGKLYEAALMGAKVSTQNRINRKFEKMIKILDTIPTDTFITTDLKNVCSNFTDYKAYHKKIIKEKSLLEIIHRGTNQHNPSIYKKIYKD